MNQTLQPSALPWLRTALHRALPVLLCAFLVQCSSKPAPAAEEPIVATETGLASYYGRAFEGERTASGEIFNSSELVAAHPSYPMGTVARVTNLENDSVVQVRIIDRGPTDENLAEGVIIDLSKGAAERLHMVQDGRVRVRVDVLQWGTDEYKKEDSL